VELRGTVPQLARRARTLAPVRSGSTSGWIAGADVRVTRHDREK
jgi:hypothetical protein